MHYINRDKEKSINSHKNHLTNPHTNIIITKMIIFVVINQTYKHKGKIYNQCAYTLIIMKNVYFFSLLFIRMSGNFNDKK